FTWIETLTQHHSGLFHWRIVPVLNPDGLLQRPAQRMNANGVDLNRNFPSPDWQRQAHQHWVEKTARNPRRYPGSSSLSEPESRWLASEIERFRPDVIVAVHAPLEVLDFDGPPDPPRSFGPLRLHQLGTYPGSLGRWAGVHLGLPVVTIELPSAGIMPTPAQQHQMWLDLVRWLQKRLPEPSLEPTPLAR
ncbi:MAG: murein peptide amidase A, partial [bacterium]|nr:murein peptide amidase A [bacterium]